MIDFNQFVPDLSEGAADQLKKLRPLFEEWNAAINVISRKDMDAFEERHVLHSLAIFKAMRFSPGSRVLDVGTGGGFPGIPLAIVCPEVDFILCDSIGKKMKVVRAIVKELGLKNVTVHHGRAEEISGRFDFVISRAVTRMDRFLPWVMNKIEERSLNPWPNGVLALKGGDLKEEMNEIKQTTEIIPISQWFDSPFFETKSVVYVKLK
jgi:16S rRNA (guanine527-N7)-methyltransferase